MNNPLLLDFSLHVLDLFMNSARCESSLITVDISMTESELSFSISDNGCGMTDEQISHSMNMLPGEFFQTGNGIPLARRFAEHHGGAFVMEHNKDNGITSCMVIPVKNLAPDEFGNIADTIRCILMKSAEVPESVLDSEIDVVIDITTEDGNLHIETEGLKAALEEYGLTLEVLVGSSDFREDLDDKIRSLFGGIER